jgi:hypothetical protein
LRLFAVVCGVCGCLRLFAVVCGVCGCLRCLCFLGRPVTEAKMTFFIEKFAYQFALRTWPWLIQTIWIVDTLKVLECFW